MKMNRLAVALSVAMLSFAPAFAAAPAESAAATKPAASAALSSTQLVQKLMKPQSSLTRGRVTVNGKAIDYQAEAGTLVLDGTGVNESVPELAIGYVAYFRQGAAPASRPITFIYNGGPGSATMWLHMGSVGPKRVVTNDDTHTPAAPYQIVENEYSLLDASDLVFIDLPGTGFGRLLPQGADEKARAASQKELAKKYWGVDQDAQAFARFVTQFLSTHNRWNSPKYLFGESYGTPRSAVLANALTTQYNVELNGVILLSSILNFSLSVDGADNNPGVDLPYVVGLPTYAATAWYHKKLPKYANATVEQVVDDAIKFARGDLQQALLAGGTLDPAQKQDVAQKLSDLIGLPVPYLLKANLRVDGGMFEQQLLGDTDTTAGRLDSRFTGPSMDPLAKSRGHDPQSAAISGAYVAAVNSYMRNDLKFGDGWVYRPSARVAPNFRWDYDRVPTFGRGGGSRNMALNVLPDLARAMKYNSNLKVLLMGGYYDIATPFYTAIYELEHLPIQDSLRKNISYKMYPSGHMVYAHLPSLQKMHGDLAEFIESTSHAPR
jgi:carboxypeptidase C (cathepsin A)